MSPGDPRTMGGAAVAVWAVRGSALSERATREVCRATCMWGWGPFGLVQVLLDQGRFKKCVTDMSQGRTFMSSVGFSMSGFLKIFKVQGGSPFHFLTGLPFPLHKHRGGRSLHPPVLLEHVGVEGRGFWNGSYRVWSVSPWLSCSNGYPLCVFSVVSPWWPAPPTSPSTPTRPLHPPTGNVPRKVFLQNFPVSSRLYFTYLLFSHRFFCNTAYL